MVYTNYTGNQDNEVYDIYMFLYDPVSGRYSDTFLVGHFPISYDLRMKFGFQIQSQLQITAGDYDKDSIDEIAVYSPATSAGDGGYVITASYAGSAIFYPAQDPEEYHYLRNIGECVFLSMKSSYYFGEDVTGTTGLFDYKARQGGKR